MKYILCMMIQQYLLSFKQICDGTACDVLDLKNYLSLCFLSSNSLLKCLLITLFLCQSPLFTLKMLKNERVTMFNHWLNDLTHIYRLVNFGQYLTSGWAILPMITF
jgi:hypothetical protein